MFDSRLNQEAFKYKGICLLLVCFAVIGGLLAISQGFLIATIVDQVFLQKQPLSYVESIVWILLCVFIVRGLLNYGNTRAGVILAARVKNGIRNRLLQKFSQTQPGYLQAQHAGSTVSILTDAVDQLDEYYSRYAAQVLQAIIIPLMILVVVMMNNVYSGLIMLITAPLIPVFMVLIGKSADSKSRRQFDSMMTFSGHFLDILQGLTTLKVFGRGNKQRDSIIEMSNRFRDTTMDVLKIAFLSALMLEILATISTAMIAIEIGLRLVYAQLTFQTAFFVLLLAPELYLPLKNLGSSFHAGKNSIAAADKIWEVLEAEHPAPQWGQAHLGFAEGDQSRNTELRITGVSFTYDEGRMVVNNVSLSARTGMRVTLIGKSGSGKTTLLKLIAGLLPLQTGEITVNGRIRSEFSEQSWFESVAYVAQEPYLFAGTIRENIALGKGDATPQQVELAARIAGVERFTRDLPDSLDTMLGEGGRGLSGGERQRVALARAFLKDAPIVVFDEPTSGLDLETEQLLLKAMEELGKRALVISVAHRLQTVVDADMIIVLSDGEIAASGSHEQLLEASDMYRQIVSGYRGERS